MAEFFTGGCQCGAVRYRAEGPVRHASVCNCRMCQKALGNLFAPFVSFEGPVTWTRGEPSEFRSSEMVHRGFCNQCGTPLTYRWGDRAPSLTIGSLDRPTEVLPTIEYARDNRHPLFAHLGELVEEDIAGTDEERDFYAILRSFQHPDRDTQNWPPHDRATE